jgi:hypothetical protein
MTSRLALPILCVACFFLTPQESPPRSGRSRKLRSSRASRQILRAIRNHPSDLFTTPLNRNAKVLLDIRGKAFGAKPQEPQTGKIFIVT